MATWPADSKSSLAKRFFSVFIFFIFFFFKKFKTIFTRYKNIGYSMRAWLLTELWLIALLPSLIARRRVDPQTK